MRILIVEDDKTLSDGLVRYLSQAGNIVETAASGTEADTLLVHEDYDLVILDVGLPGMDGYAVARALKMDPASAAIELIALTGYGSERDRQRAQEAGFRHHFTKPIKLDDLQAALA